MAAAAAAGGAAGEVVVALCCGWKATVQRSYPRRRSGVLRVIQVILLGSMIAFLRRAPERSGHVTFLLAVTCLVLVTVVIIYMTHFLPLHHPQHCPHPRRRCCQRLCSVLETLHDGVSSLVLLPAAILLLLLPALSPSTAAAAVLTIVLVLLLAFQCAENLLRALQPTQHPQEDQGEEMGQVEQATPSPGSRSGPTGRDTPYPSRGRESARLWSKNRKNPASPLLPLYPAHSGSPVSTSPRYSIYSSRQHSSPPFSSCHTPLPFPGSHASPHQQYSPPPTSPCGCVTSSSTSSLPPFPSASMPQPPSPSIAAIHSPSSPLLSNPKTSPHLSSCSVPLSTPSSTPPPLSHCSVPQSPLASNVHVSSVLSRPRTSSRIPSSCSSPPLTCMTVTSLPHDPNNSHLSPQKDVPLSQSQDVVQNSGHIELWHDDPPSPICFSSSCPPSNYSPSTGPSPSYTHTQGLSVLPSSTASSLTTDTPMYSNINCPLDITFTITPFASNTFTVPVLTHVPSAHTTTPSLLTNTASPTHTTPNPDPTRPSISAIYAMPCDASANRDPIYENSPPLTVSTTIALDVTSSTSGPTCHSPVYATVLSHSTTTTANPHDIAGNSTNSPGHCYSPVSYL